MRRKAKNNKTKLNWRKRRPGSLGKNHPIIPQFIFPAQENLEQTWLLEVGKRVVW